MSTPRSLARADNVTRTDVETARGTLATLTCLPTESSRPRGQVLLIPGFTGSKEDFAALLPLLAETAWSAVAYDQRGQFESPVAADEDFSLAGLAADARALCHAVFGTAQVHLVGHSFGGLVAASAALRWPKAWASLTLLCSGPGGLDPGLRDEPLAAAAALERKGLEWVYQAMAKRDREHGRPPDSPDIEEFLHRRFLANSADSLAAMARHLGEAPDFTADLAALDLPVAVMRGERDDAWPHDVQDRLAEALDTAVVVIADAAHSPAWEQPEQTRDALVRFWMS